MSRRSWWVVTLLCSALGLTLGVANALELPQKLGYRPELFAGINPTFYQYCALASGVLTVGSLLSAGALTYGVRQRPVLPSMLGATACLALSLVLWFALVSPVNAEVTDALRTAPNTVPALWQALRDRWEYGLVASFAAWLLGAVLLTYSAVLELPVGDEATPATEAVRVPRETRPQLGRPRSAA